MYGRFEVLNRHEVPDMYAIYTFHVHGVGRVDDVGSWTLGVNHWSINVALDDRNLCNSILPQLLQCLLGSLLIDTIEGILKHFDCFVHSIFICQQFNHIRCLLCDFFKVNLLQVRASPLLPADPSSCNALLEHVIDTQFKLVVGSWDPAIQHPSNEYSSASGSLNIVAIHGCG